MRKRSLWLGAATLAAIVFLAGTSMARQRSASSTVPVTTVVTVLGPNFSAPPAITQADVTVYSGKNRQDVTSWVPAKGDKAGMQLAILIDDADSPTAIGQHFTEIKNFITSQPATTQVGIYYATSGTTQAAAKLDSDHEAVAKKLRLPLGRLAGTSPSIYISLQDFVSHWPPSGMRHEVLMIASGVDRLYPGIEDPYLADAIKHVQMSGVVVHTIYTGGPRLADTLFRMDIAWQNLIQVADDSGGLSFFQGYETPVDFVPILRQLDMALNNQYLLTFNTPRSNSKKGEMRDIRIRMEQRGVRLHYSTQVFVPGA
jgi:hypothetical protein